MDDISCVSPLISEEDYPLTAFLSTGGFCDFTAYDVETTGLSAKTECITEIGAVKVRNVMLFSKPYLNSLGICKQCAKLGELAAALNVRNPRAHRAFADALTTAKIYVCLQTGKTE